MEFLIGLIIVVAIVYFGVKFDKKSKKEEEERKKEKLDKVNKIKINKIADYLYGEEKKEFPKKKKQEKISDKRWLCESCDYKWESKKKFGEPSTCPRCKKDNIIKYSKTKEWEEEFRKAYFPTKEKCKDKAENLVNSPFTTDESYVNSILMQNSSERQSVGMEFDAEELTINCPFCNHEKNISISQMPKKGESMTFVCDDCEQSIEMKLPKESYQCDFCKKDHNNFTAMKKHLKTCKEKLKNSIICESCKKELILDEKEKKELDKKKKIKIDCPICKNKFSVKRDKDKLKEF